MRAIFDPEPIELHLFSSEKDNALVELLTITAYFHRFDEKVGLWHTVNFGRPWKVASSCSYGLLSLPYLDGPQLEVFNIDHQKQIYCYWLIPLTQAEVAYKKAYGVDKLEEIFEAEGLDYINPHRKSLV